MAENRDLMNFGHKDLTNRDYVEYRCFLAEADRWDAGRVSEWKWQEIRRVLARAWRTPGYRRAFEAAGVTDPREIRDEKDFCRLPTIDKETLRDNLDAYTIPVDGAKYTTTGGSTGVPFGFYYDPKAFSRTLAARAHQYARRGWREGDRQFVLRGGSAGSGENVIATPDHMEFSEELCELRASASFLTHADVKKYLEKAWEYRPDWLRVYPSAGFMLARLLRETGWTFPPVKGVLSSAENLYPHQKTLMEEVFGARVFSHYGHMELAALAGMCETSDAYHVLPFYGHVELLPMDGGSLTPVETKDGMGEIVATSFIMNSTLFVRYRTRDYAIYGGRGCPECSRPYDLWTSIEGRLQEFAVTKSGRIMSMTTMNMYDDVFDRIKQFQFRQRERGVMEFVYVPKSPDGCRPEEIERMRSRILEKFDGDMELFCVPVESVPLTGRGKHRFLVQELPIGEI